MLAPTDTGEDSQQSMPDVKTGEGWAGVGGGGGVGEGWAGVGGWGYDPDMVTPTDKDSQQTYPMWKQVRVGQGCRWAGQGGGVGRGGWWEEWGGRGFGAWVVGWGRVLMVWALA